MDFDPDDEEWAETLRLLRKELEKRRGYADFWSWSLDRRRAEERAAEVLYNYLVRAADLPTGSLTAVSDDPPDVVLNADDLCIGIEVTELVDGDVVARHRERRKRGEPPTLDFAEWTPDRIAKTLASIIAAKDHKLRKAAPRYAETLLAIITDDLIDEKMAEAGVARCRSLLPKNIDRAFLILSYHPSTDARIYPDRCLVLPIALSSEK